MGFMIIFINRRRTQTFLPADPAGKKHVNRFAIKKSATVGVGLAVNLEALAKPIKPIQPI
jgi:hypothetical protein